MTFCIPLKSVINTRSIKNTIIQCDFRLNGKVCSEYFRFSKSQARDELVNILKAEISKDSIQARQRGSDTHIPKTDSVKGHERSTALKRLTDIITRKINSMLFQSLLQLIKSKNDHSRMTLFSLCVVSQIERSLRRSTHSALLALAKNSVVSIQTEALTAAESLASLNEEFLTKIDSVPLQIGLKNISSLMSMTDFKLKMIALNELRFN